ncbi:MAG TPA: class I SAM-dependent methyltransferase [Polyangiaceae bacterium]|nr:class I SAM-dependent methyltransferase [Polyangiaceae bacterium]
MDDTLRSTRDSWDAATRRHNAHKGDQAAFLRGGGDTLFEEELALLGPLGGKELVHLQCNAGQDTLCLARRGARATGVDLCPEAVAFARRLSAESGIAAEFVEAELVAWLGASEPARWDVAFSSYGAVGWLRDLDAWARGVARVLRPGGRFVYVEFHPIVWSFDRDFAPKADDYFATAPFVEPVGDYVAQSGAALGAVGPSATPASATPANATPADEPPANTTPAWSYQHTLGNVVSALARAGLVLERLEEYPYANGCRLKPCLVPLGDRRWALPEGVARLPLMFGLAARKP